VKTRMVVYCSTVQSDTLLYWPVRAFPLTGLTALNLLDGSGTSSKGRIPRNKIIVKSAVVPAASSIPSSLLP
jgi:hypothetical protein